MTELKSACCLSRTLSSVHRPLILENNKEAVVRGKREEQEEDKVQEAQTLLQKPLMETHCWSG